MTSPDPFAHVIGQPRACELLRRALASGRIAHAYLFFGPAQTGKTTLLHAFAQALLGSRPQTCADWRAWSPEGARGIIKVDHVRELIRCCATPPLGAGYQVFAVFGAEALNRESGNALLKTLEEPPGRTVIVLVAERLEAVLPTIRSRVALIPTGLVPADRIASTLVQQGVDPTRATTLASQAEGRIGRAILAAGEADPPGRWPAMDLRRPLGRLEGARALGELAPAELKLALGERLQAQWRDSPQPASWESLVALDAAIARLEGNVNAKLVIDTLIDSGILSQ